MTNQQKSENRMPCVPLTCVIVINTETPLTCPLYFLSIRNLHVAQSAHFYHYPLSVCDLIPINGSIHTTQCAQPPLQLQSRRFKKYAKKRCCLKSTKKITIYLNKMNLRTQIFFFFHVYQRPCDCHEENPSFFKDWLQHTRNRNVLNRFVRQRRCISVKVMKQHAHQWKDIQIIN